MTAARIVTVPPSVTATRAHAVLDAVLRMNWPAGRKARRAIGGASVDLDAALDTYGSIAGGVAHWEAVYPHLSVTADPEGEALMMAAAEAGDCARSLTAAVAAHCGTEAAAELTAGTP